MLTAATYRKVRYLQTDTAKQHLLELILNKFTDFNWIIMAYSIMDDHYHLMAQAAEDPVSLPKTIAGIHKLSAMRINRQDGVKGRKIWWNYWDTLITYERSYYARLNYIHFNCVKHGYTDDPLKYRFSSYGSFYSADPERARAILAEYPFDTVKVRDQFWSAATVSL